MHIRRGLFLLAAFAALAFTPSYASTRRLVFGYYDAKPSSYRDEKGTPAGIFIDSLKLIAEREGWEIEYSFRTWEALLEGLKRGTIDIVPAIVRTPEREAFAAFTQESIMTDWGMVFVREGEGLGSVLELDGKKVGALSDDFWFSGPGSLKDLCVGFGISPTYIYFDDYPSLFLALEKGRIEAVAASNSLGIIWEPLLPIAATSIIYNPIELRFAVSRAGAFGPELARELDQAMKNLRSSNPALLRESLGKHQVPIRKQYEIPQWAVTVLAVLSLVSLGLSALLALQLKAQAIASGRTAQALEKLKKASGELESSLREKDLLVHELSHRVKNNLQLVLSLLGLVQADDERGGFATPVDDLREKVYSLALIEEELHDRSVIDEASLLSFLDSLSMRMIGLFSLLPGELSFSVDLRGMALSPQAAAPIAIIVNELVSNACAYGKKGSGRLDASIRIEGLEEGSGFIEVADQGVGLPAGIDLEAASSLGFRLVAALAQQLKGKVVALSTASESGTRIRVTMGPSAFSAKKP